jgi:hypothetical protein
MQLTTFTFDIAKLSEIASSFENDNDFGAFMRKAINDLNSGCNSSDVDDRVIAFYKKSLDKLKAKQLKNEKDYNRKRGSGKPGSAACQNSNTISQQVADPCLFLDVSSKKSFGENGLVKLSDLQAAKLKELYGTDFDTAITLLEGYIENSTKGKKYKDHYKVLARGNWVFDKIQQMRLTQKRIEKVDRSGKSFAQQERDRTVRMLRGEDPDGRTDIVKDSQLSYEELRNIYG